VKAVDNEFMAFLADRRALALLQSITPQIERGRDWCGKTCHV